MSVGWVAMEALNRALSAAWAQHGVRSICLRTTELAAVAVFLVSDQASAMTVTAEGVSRIVAFHGSALFPLFGL